METSTPMKTPAEAGLPARGKAAGGSSMIKATEGARMGTRLSVWCRESMLATRESSRSSTMKSVGPMKSTGAIEAVTVGKDPTVGYVAVVVEHDPVGMPVVSPVSPSPAKPAKKTNSKAKAKLDSWTGKEQSRIRVPSRPDTDGRSIHEPRIILRNVNNLRVRGLDHNGLPLIAYLLLRCALQVSRLLRTVAHYLNRIHHLLLLVDVSIAKR